MIDRNVKNTRELIDALVVARKQEEKSQEEVGTPFYTRSQISKLEHAEAIPALDKVFHVLANLNIRVHLKRIKKK